MKVILSDDRAGGPSFGDLPVGDCFITGDGGAVWRKTRKSNVSEHGHANAIRLSDALGATFTATVRVVRIEMVAIEQSELDKLQEVATGEHAARARGAGYLADLAQLTKVASALVFASGAVTAPNDPSALAKLRRAAIAVAAVVAHQAAK